MKSEISKLRKKENDYKLFCKNNFIDFLRREDRVFSFGKIVNIRDIHDLDNLYSGCGFYIILSNYNFQNNNCSYIKNDLKAIYRGHCYGMKKRIESHLFNDKYNINKKNTNYSCCLKLNNSSGINIDNNFYSNFKWMIVQYKMPDSTKIMREQVEQAFDYLYLRPFASHV